MRHLPVAFWSSLLRKAFGIRPSKPWWPYDAINKVEELLRNDIRAIEFGAGNSTLWLANRVLHLTSIEDDHNWYLRVAEMLSASNVKNVQLLFKSGNKYYDLSDLPRLRV